MLRSLVFVVLTVYVGFGAYLYAFQRSFIYHPTPDGTAAGYERLAIASDGERIQVWRSNPGRASAVIYFGGNAEAVGYGAADLARILPRHTLYLVDYRGYGGSSGVPSEAGLYLDALAVYDAIGAEHAEITALGRSLGSGVATYLAVQRPLDRLVLVTPFDNFESLAKGLYPVYPVGLLLRESYDSLARAPAIRAPTLIVIAAQDRQIPPDHARRLAAAFAAGQVEVVEIPDADHFSVSLRPGYAAALQGFLTRIEADGVQPP